MKILLDAIPLKGLMTGISRYLRNLYVELERMPGVTVYYTDSYACTTQMPAQAVPGPWMKATSFIWKLPDPVAYGFRAATWMAYEMRLRRMIRRNCFTVYHETAFTPSLVKDLPQVLTLHDLSLMKFREMHPKERVWFMDHFFKRRIQYAAHIITVSEFVRGEICDELHIPPERVTAIHEAPDPIFFPREKEVAKAVIKILGLPQDYLLFVGTMDPRKNISTLLKALAICQNDIPIVFVGWEGWGRDMLMKSLNDSRLERRVFTTGYVDEEALACLYSNAKALVFPSLYEGFGLPLLEAMACHCPVICSNAASLPEVAGDAAVYIDPSDPEGLASAIVRVVGDSALSEELIQKGLRRVADFSWEKAGRETLEVFNMVKSKWPATGIQGY